MSRRVTISAGDISLTAVLNDSASAEALWNALPVEERVRTWGDEIYFPIEVLLEEEDPQETVEMGALGYWPPGHALCLFFGPTPASRGDEIRPASPVNLLGYIEGDATLLKQVQPDTPVRVERAT